MGPIIVQATLNIARTILGISSLSFVGLGISPPTPEWGSMLSEGKTMMRYYPHLILIPGRSDCTCGYVTYETRLVLAGLTLHSELSGKTEEGEPSIGAFVRI